MNQQLKRVTIVTVAGAFIALVAGCESLDIATNGTVTDPAAVGISRAQVVAELREAERLGLITVGEGDVPQATEEQLRQIAQAGQRAVTANAVAAK